MDFSLPGAFVEDLGHFREFLRTHLKPNLSRWYKDGEVPRDFFRELGRGGWLGYERRDGGYVELPALKQALLIEELGKISPGVGVAVLVHISLGTKGLSLFGPDGLRNIHMEAAVRGDSLFCLGNTEPTAGSDVAGIATRAVKTDGGWIVNGTKSFVTNGAISDYALVTAVSDRRRTETGVFPCSSWICLRKGFHEPSSTRKSGFRPISRGCNSRTCSFPTGTLSENAAGGCSRCWKYLPTAGSTSARLPWVPRWAPSN